MIDWRWDRYAIHHRAYSSMPLAPQLSNALLSAHNSSSSAKRYSSSYPILHHVCPSPIPQLSAIVPAPNCDAHARRIRTQKRLPKNRYVGKLRFVPNLIGQRPSVTKWNVTPSVHSSTELKPVTANSGFVRTDPSKTCRSDD